MTNLEYSSVGKSMSIGKSMCIDMMYMLTLLELGVTATTYQNSANELLLFHVYGSEELRRFRSSFWWG